jgi:hypothetical protein
MLTAAVSGIVSIGIIVILIAAIAKTVLKILA